MREKFRQPEWPNGTPRWLSNPSIDNSGIRLLGVLVLKKGESTDNGKIGVRVIDIVEGDACAHFAFSKSRKAVIEFFAPKDNRIICQVTLLEHSTGTLDCPDELGISAYGVQAINTRDRWVLFDLRE